MEVPGVAEDIDGEIDGTEPAAHLRPDLAPVVLDLLARKRLVPDGSLAGPTGLRLACGRCRQGQIPAHGAFRTANAMGDVHNVRPLGP